MNVIMICRQFSLIPSRFGSLLMGLLLIGLGISSQAQAVLSVTNFGAHGDAVQFYVNTVSNSTVVTTTNPFSSADIGKTIEVFGVGKTTFGINSYGVQTNGWQDVIAIVTNVVNATNLYLNVLPQDGVTSYIPSVTTTAWATIGTDNTLAMSNCIAAAAGFTNATIYIPHGTYLMMSQAGNGGYAYCAVPLRRGGLHFLGENKTNTTLLSRAARQSYSVFNLGNYCFRGFLFECVAPITNDYPLIFENLTLDGGVQQGNLNVHGIALNQVDGLGWDEQHSAYLTFDASGYTTSWTASRQVFTNVNVLRWRGESFKSIDQNTNGTIDIQNCLFADICATALNVYPCWNVRNNVFSNCWQVTEYYQKFYRGTAYFCNNLITNSDAQAGYGRGYVGNAVSVNGGIWTASPLVIQSNILGNPNGYACITFVCTPAANVSILNNQIYCEPYSQVFNVGAAGSQGTDCNSNILISGNSVYCPGNLISIFSLGGDGINAAYNVTVCSNTIANSGSIQWLTCGNPHSYNLQFFDNDASGAGSAGVQTGVCGTNYSPFMLFQVNNSYNALATQIGSVQTNLVSYSAGPKTSMYIVATSNAFVLEDSTSNQIPAGAMLQIDNRNNHWQQWGGGTGDTSGNVIVYPSQSMASSEVVSNGTMASFYWNGVAWTNDINAMLYPNLIVSSGTGTGSYLAGSVVTVTATSISGKTFTQWSGATNILANPFSPVTTAIIPNGNVNITANYSATVLLLPPTGLKAYSAP